MSLLRLVDLHHTYLAGTPMARVALRGVSLEIAEGQTVALVGGGRSGKSTVIDYLNGLQRPPPGHVFFDGQDIAAPGFDLDRLRASVGVVFQQPESQLIEDVVGKDVSFGPRRAGLTPAESRERVREALESVGLDYEAFRNRYVYALSGGQKRRVAIAGVLAMHPRVLVLDEPTAGLDPKGRVDLLDLIARLRAGRRLTVVIASSSLNDVAHLADHVYVLHEGKVAMAGTPRELLRDTARLAALGVALPEAAAVAAELRPVLPSLPTTLLDLDELTDAVVERLGAGAPVAADNGD